MATPGRVLIFCSANRDATLESEYDDVVIKVMMMKTVIVIVIEMMVTTMMMIAVATTVAGCGHDALVGVEARSNQRLHECQRGSENSPKVICV